MKNRYKSDEAWQNYFAYTNNYNKENYDRITILRPKGDREKLKAMASQRGISVNEMLNSLIDKYLGI